jgi:hypothetical protein
MKHNAENKTDRDMNESRAEKSGLHEDSHPGIGENCGIRVKENPLQPQEQKTDQNIRPKLVPLPMPAQDPAREVPA